MPRWLYSKLSFLAFWPSSITENLTAKTNNSFLVAEQANKNNLPNQIFLHLFKSVNFFLFSKNENLDTYSKRAAIK